MISKMAFKTLAVPLMGIMTLIIYYYWGALAVLGWLSSITIIAMLSPAVQTIPFIRRARMIIVMVLIFFFIYVTYTIGGSP